MAIKVMIVDDSAIVRRLMKEVLSKERDIKVIATAVDPIFAREKMNTEWPDVLLLDIEMPRMDGISFLKLIMAERPTPVVICSSHTEKSTDLCLEALSAGAVGIVNKPAIGFKDFIQDSSADLLTAIRSAAQARVSKLKLASHSKPSPSSSNKTSREASSTRLTNEQLVAPKLSADAILPAANGTSASVPTTEKVMVIGTSTGGTQALETILTKLAPNCAGLAIVQHMPEKFTASFAARLNSLCDIEVREAKNNDKIMPGLALIAPGGKHMLLRRTGTQYYVEIVEGPLVNRHRPSVDVLFRSTASAAGRNAVGYILTGMGDDGAKGLLEMANAGCITYAQNEDSCVVFGMPKEAIALSAAKEIIALDAVAASISSYR